MVFMVFTVRKAVLVVASVACAGLARRTHYSNERLQSRSNWQQLAKGDLGLLNSFATLLLASRVEATFNAPAPEARLLQNLRTSPVSQRSSVETQNRVGHSGPAMSMSDDSQDADVLSNHGSKAKRQKPVQLSRAQLLGAMAALPAARALADVMPVATALVQPAASPGMTSGMSATVTDRAYFDIRIIKSYETFPFETSEFRLTFGMFGKDAPKGAAKFLDFLDGTIGQFKNEGTGPRYAQSTFEKIQPGVLVEGGNIGSLGFTEFAGQQEYEYNGRLLPLRAVPEANNLKHDRRGLITRKLFTVGPEFSVTLAPAPQLDGTNEVIGQLEPTAENEALLAQIESLPYITGKAREGAGTPADKVYQAQKKFFQGIAKQVGDERLQDRTGQLLRRVEFIGCGRLGAGGKAETKEPAVKAKPKVEKREKSAMEDSLVGGEVFER